MARNVRLWPGEIDLLVEMDGDLVAVEVKTRSHADPVEELTDLKIERVRRSGDRLDRRPDRYDLVAVRLTAGAPRSAGFRRCADRSRTSSLAAVEAAEFAIPARSMPVLAEVGGQFRDHHEVALADGDPAFAARAEIPLAGGIGLHGGGDLYAERAAHSTNTTATRMVPATKATSTNVVRCLRNGLNPIGAS